MNWGKGLAIGYISFALLLAGMVYLTTTVTPELVTTDYYARELAFQDKIDARDLATKDGLEVSFDQDDNGLNLSFNAEVSDVTIEVIRPSDSRLDMDLAFGQDAPVTAYLIANEDLQTGPYSFMVEWSVGEKRYYSKQNYYYQ